MSSVIPPSFVDDGISYHKCTRHGKPSQHVEHQITRKRYSASAYSGSFVDDGADMLLPSSKAPGFGKLDTRFYTHRKKPHKEKLWNDDVQKALVGDMQRSLTGLRDVGDLEVRRRTGNERTKEDEKYQRRKNTVTVPVPRRWGTFVIKSEDGRVIIIGENAEFDSGPQVLKGKENEKRQGTERKRWVEASSTVYMPRALSKSSTRCHNSGKYGKGEYKKDGYLLSPREPKRKVFESDYGEFYQPVVDKNLETPESFFITGGASGWPSPETSVVTSPVKSARNDGRSHSLSPVKQKSVSSRHSPPGAWPSPPHSYTNSTSPVKHCSTEQSDVGSWVESKANQPRGSAKSRRSRRHDGDNVSVKTHSTYKAPMVEDAQDSSTDNFSMLKEAGWRVEQVHDHEGRADDGNGNGKARDHSYAVSKQINDADWPDSVEDSLGNSRLGSPVANDKSWTAREAKSGQHWSGSMQNWVEDRVKTVSNASSRRSWNPKSKNNGRSPAYGQQKRRKSIRTSETSWDGYERPKTMSEVSVAGSESRRNWSGSHVSSRRSAETPPHRSHRRHNSRSSRRSSQSGSQIGWAIDGSDWGGSQKANVGGWDGDDTK